MTVAKKILGTAVGEDESNLYVDDVFSTYLYTGNGSTQTINNGIDLAGKGGMVWIKGRTTSTFLDHTLWDSARVGTGGQRFGAYLASNLTTAETRYPSNFSHPIPGSTGFSFGTGGSFMNQNAVNYVSWTFRRAPKSFDVVTYTGDGVTGRQIPHGLGVAPGFITTKSTSVSGDWNTYHRSATGDLRLNLTNAQTASRAIITAADAGTFTVSGVANTNGVQYVAYLFAHDPSADGIIQCGGFTTGSIGTVTDVNLGWEPQFLLWRTPSDADSWNIVDSMRGFSETSYSSLQPNTSNAEIQFNFTDINRGISPTATGFKGTAGQSFGANQTIIYLAIRRPNKPPTTGTEVYSAIARPGSGASQETDCGITFDACLNTGRTSVQQRMFDKLRGISTSSYGLITTSTGGEVLYEINPPVSSSNNQNHLKFLYASGVLYISYLFRRAPGFFDVACYTGTGLNASTVCYHSLGVIPELVFIKSRTTAAVWVASVRTGTSTGLKGFVSSSFFSPVSNYNIYATAKAISPHWFDPSNGSNSLTNGTNYVAYLFASLPGISKVGSYLGNGGSLVVDCGFTTGARFILIKRTDSTGDWYIWDTARGIIAANDPHLSLNTQAAEVTTDDSVDPYTAGFIVNQNTATNINVSGGQYIFLAIA